MSNTESLEGTIRDKVKAFAFEQYPHRAVPEALDEVDGSIGHAILVGVQQLPDVTPTSDQDPAIVGDVKRIDVIRQLRPCKLRDHEAGRYSQSVERRLVNPVGYNGRSDDK